MTLYSKMRQLFYYKMRQKFITRCVRFFITKCNSYYKLRQFYYKMRQLLQIATFITNCDNTVTLTLPAFKFKYELWKDNLIWLQFILIRFLLVSTLSRDNILIISKVQSDCHQTSKIELLAKIDKSFQQ